MGEEASTGEWRLLARDLIAALDPRLRDALNHPTRREILRLLHAGGARSVGELAADLSPLSRGEIAYHAQVLESSECVAADGSRPGPGGEERLLRSAVADSEQAQLVLRATRRPDQGLRQQTAEAGSAGALTMFRVPRPGRTVSLLNRHGRGAERRG